MRGHLSLRLRESRDRHTDRTVEYCGDAASRRQSEVLSNRTGNCQRPSKRINGARLHRQHTQSRVLRDPKDRIDGVQILQRESFVDDTLESTATAVVNVALSATSMRALGEHSLQVVVHERAEVRAVQRKCVVVHVAVRGRFLVELKGARTNPEDRVIGHHRVGTRSNTTLLTQFQDKVVNRFRAKDRGGVEDARVLV